MQAAEYRATHREELAAKQRAYLAAHPEIAAAYYERNKVRIAARAAERYQKNKATRVEYSCRYRAEHPETVKAHNDRWHADHHEEELEVGRRYYAKNADKLNHKNSKWRRDNRGAIRLREARYRAEHSEEVQIWRRNGRARKMQAPGEYTIAEWRALLVLWDHCCAYCGREIKKTHTRQPWTATQDHIVPLIRGGWNCGLNIVPACNSCNVQKNSKLLSEWFAEGE